MSHNGNGHNGNGSNGNGLNGNGSNGYGQGRLPGKVAIITGGGQGIGRKLMSLAEAEASSRGCSAVWLDTFEFQARSFYERLGYTCFGQLENYPKGFARFFMQKALSNARDSKA